MSSDKDIQEVLRVLETLQPRQPDWLARLRSMNDADRRAVIERAVKRAVDELVRCIDDTVKSGAPNIYLMSCVEVLRLALEAEAAPVGPNGHDNGQVSPHGGGFIKPSASKVSSNPVVDGVTAETPKVETRPSRRGGDHEFF